MSELAAAANALGGAGEWPGATQASEGDLKRRWVEQAVRQYEGRLVLYAARIVGEVERARDVVQEAFARLWEQDRREVGPRLAEWLYTVCRNRALDVRAREGRQRPLDAADPGGRRDPGRCPAEAAEARDAHARALAAMARLPARQQEVLRLKFQGGLSYEEIAEVTGLSVGNVGFVLHTALKELRWRLGVATASTVEASGR